MTRSATISPDALALRWSLRSTHGSLRRTALEIVRRSLAEYAGNLSLAAPALGIRDSKNLKTMIDENPELAAARVTAREKSPRGDSPKTPKKKARRHK